MKFTLWRFYIMKKYSNHRVEIAECPVCGAICKVGNDEDGQIFCAACRVTFKPHQTQKITQEEYKALYDNARETHMVIGGEALLK